MLNFWVNIEVGLKNDGEKGYRRLRVSAVIALHKVDNQRRIECAREIGQCLDTIFL